MRTPTNEAGFLQRDLALVSIGAIAMVALVIGGVSLAYAEDKHSPAQQPPASADVQERGVTPGTEGVIVQGNQLRAAPGYVLEKGSNKQMTARPRSGGGRSLTLDCGCQGGTGNCGIDSSGDVAICHRDSVQPCSGTCGWSSLPSKVGPPSMR